MPTPNDSINANHPEDQSAGTDSNASKALRLLIIAGTVAILDQMTKALILRNLPLYTSRSIIPGFFDLTHIHNPGGAFGFLSGQSSTVQTAVFLFASALAAGIILYLYWTTPGTHRFLSFGFALIFGGAIGNMIDRVRLGKVVDFLDFYIGNVHYPAFNIADSAVTIGIGIFIYHLVLNKMPK